MPPRQAAAADTKPPRQAVAANTKPPRQAVATETKPSRRVAPADTKPPRQAAAVTKAITRPIIVKGDATTTDPPSELLVPTDPIILAIDPGASCGYAVVRVNILQRSAEVIEHGHIDIDTKSPEIGDLCLDLMAKLDVIQSRVSATEVAAEDFFFSKRKCSGAAVNVFHRATVHIWARKLGLRCRVLGICAWKTMIAGRATPTREEKALWGAEPAKKLMIARALWQRHGIKFSNFSISNATGKVIEPRYDAIDAVGQGLYAAHMQYACTAYSSSVALPPDFAFAKPNRARLDYAAMEQLDSPLVLPGRVPPPKAPRAKRGPRTLA